MDDFIEVTLLRPKNPRGGKPESNEDLDAEKVMFNTHAVFTCKAVGPEHKLPPLIKTFLALPIGEFWLAESYEHMRTLLNVQYIPELPAP